MRHKLIRVMLLGTTLWSASAGAHESDMHTGERLSDWLLRQDPSAYRPGLFWQIPEQHDEQAKIKHQLLAWLTTREQASEAARQRLTELIAALPITGRVRLLVPDARWLQAHPTQDPILEYGQRVTLPNRPDWVSVIADDGHQCRLPHRPGLEARAYLKACQPDVMDRVDHAWLIQPDGAFQQFGIAAWNEQKQDEPAPGARIWGPARDTGWSPRFSALFAQFLATQGITDTTMPQELPFAPATDAYRPAHDHALTANDWGVIGLLQTPSARMSATGEVRFHYSQVTPYQRGSILLQPLEWLEAGFRYTNITNRLYGPDIAGDQQYKDKSFDAKVKLTKELAYLPQIAVGATDVGGTGLFSSEYLVANKRTGDLDWSVGIGWGYLAGSGNFRNPLSWIDPRFDTRPGGSSSVSGGTVNSASFFRGPASLFGGVQYQSPSNNLLFKVEYDGNDYQREPQNNNQRQSSRLNLGVVYRYHPSLDLTVGIERGNTFMLGFTLHEAFDKASTPKLSATPRVPVLPTRPSAEPVWHLTVSEIVDHSRWSVREISREGGELRLILDDPYGAYWEERINRIIAILHRDAPMPINRFVLTFVEHGIPMSARVVLRDSWVKKQLSLQAMMDRADIMAATEPPPKLAQGESLWKRDDRGFAIGLVPHYQQNLGGPDGFILFQAGVAAPMKLKLTDSVVITGRANLGLIDNYDKFKYDGPSNLPRVRTSLREYQTTSPLTLPNLQITHVGQLSRNQFYSVYGGLLESMYAGVGGEWLYRPWHSHVALGIDINQVRQRGFKQDFALRDYRTTTGHATLYWDTGWKSTHVNLSAGRYLAKDLGATLDVSRVFDNGVSFGAWLTKTNVSAEEFGEGTFDKGIYVSIPFDVLMTSYSPAAANLVWTPLTRDGGAKLGRGYTLYGVTNSRDKRQTSFAPFNANTSAPFDDEGPLWVTESHFFGDIGKTASTFSTQLTNGQTGNALLLGGGMVLATSLLDRPLSKWADSHQSARWNTLGKAANAMPLALAAGTGLLWLGIGDEMASETAWTSIKSAALTIAMETAMKYAVGRSRPIDQQGMADFAPFSQKASSSGFPSNHTGLAYALVTPFAQKYDANWLYALAGVTAFGRIQQREHFASDAVAGGLIGYAVGSLLLDQQRDRKIQVGPQSIQVSWQFK